MANGSSGADSELTILIRTLADRYGIEAVEDDLKKLRESTDASSVSTEKHNTHHREMHALFRQLNRVLPESGHLLHGLFADTEVRQVLLFAAGIGIVLEVVKKTTEAFKALNERMVEQTARGIEVMDQQAEAARLSENSWRATNESIGMVINSFDTLKEKQDVAMATLEIYNKALVKSAGDDKVRAEALEREAERRKIHQLENIAADEAGARMKADMDLVGAHGAAAAGPEGAASYTLAKDYLAKQGDRIKKEFAEAKASLGGSSPEEVRQRAMQFPGPMTSTLLGYAERFDEAKKNKESLDAATAAVDAFEAATKRLKDAEEHATQEVEKRMKTMHDSQAAVEKEQAMAKATLDTQDTAKMVAAGLKPGSVAGRTALRFIEAEEALAHGDKLNADQIHIINYMYSQFKTAGLWADKIKEIFAETKDLTISQTQKIEDILKDLKALKSQVKSTVNQ